MNDRHPHLRFLIDAAPVLAGGMALIVFLGGIMRACQHGGLSGLFSFGVVALVAVFIYVAVRAKFELLAAILEIEAAARELGEQRHADLPPADPPKI